MGEFWSVIKTTNSARTSDSPHIALYTAQNVRWGWKFGSVVEPLACRCKVLGSNPCTAKEKRLKVDHEI